MHVALNLGISLLNPKGGYYFVFLSGVPMFRKYDAGGKLVFERHIEGLEAGSAMLDRCRRRGRAERRRRDSARAGDGPHRRRRSDGQPLDFARGPVHVRLRRAGDKRHTLQFRAAGIISPTSFFFTARSPRPGRRRDATRLTPAAELAAEAPSHQLADRPEIEIQVLRLEAELLRRDPGRSPRAASAPGRPTRSPRRSASSLPFAGSPGAPESAG